LARFLCVTRGLDPRVHLLSQRMLFASRMDCRVKPGNDGWWFSANGR